MFIKFVERVKELFLRSLFPADHLDVVDQQHIRRTIVLMKVRHSIQLDAVDHLIHESLACGVHDPHASEILDQRLADGMHQMGFPHTHAAVDKQRIIGARRQRGYRFCRSMSELIAWTNHEIIEIEFEVDLRRSGPGTECLIGPGTSGSMGATPGPSSYTDPPVRHSELPNRRMHRVSDTPLP